MADAAARCVATVLELVNAEDPDVDAVHALLHVMMKYYLDQETVYAAVNTCAHRGFVARPLSDTYECINANPRLLFQSIFRNVRDWGDLDVVGDMTSSLTYDYVHVKHLRCAVQACESRTGLLDYVQRAMRVYSAIVLAPWRYVTTVERWTIKDVLLMACKVEASYLDVDHIMALVKFHPTVGARLVCCLTLSNAERVAEDALDRVMCFLLSREVDAWTNRIMWHLSRVAPERVADAMSADDKFFKLAFSVNTACMWHMVPYIKRNSYRDNLPVEELLGDDLSRAVAAGVFTDCCVMGTAEWPLWTPIQHHPTPDSVVYYMAAYGSIMQRDAHLFAKISDVVVNTLLSQEGCWPSLAAHVLRTRNWLRRAVWMMTLSKFQKRIVGRAQCVDKVPEALRQLVAIQPLNQMIMGYL